MANQWHFDPDSYLAMVREEIAGYDGLQARLAAATAAMPANRILDLGSGTGVTARHVRPPPTLDGPAKADLFARIAAVLARAGASRCATSSCRPVRSSGRCRSKRASISPAPWRSSSPGWKPPD